MCKHCFFACLWSACDASRWFAHKPLAPNRPSAAPRTVSPGARPRRSPGGAGGARARPHRTLLERPAAGPPSRPTAPRRRAAEAPASPARIRGPMAGSRRLGGGGGGSTRGGSSVWPFRVIFFRLGPEVPAPARPEPVCVCQTAADCRDTGRRHPSPGFDHGPALSVPLGRHSLAPGPELELGQHSDTDLTSVARARAESFITERLRSAYGPGVEAPEPFK